MIYRFTIIDRNAAETVIDEPVGWDATKIVISRDPDAHGISFDYTASDFEFHGPAARMLDAEYELYGIEGVLSLRIEVNCSGYWQQLYTGKISFNDYVSYFPTDCRCTAPLENNGPLMTMRNRWDQEVDLLSNTTFDLSSETTPYTKLGFDLTIPGKTIILHDDASVVVPGDGLLVNLSGVPFIAYDTNPAGAQNYAIFNLLPQFEQLNFNEFGNFSPQSTPTNLFICSGFGYAYSYPEGCVIDGVILIPGTDVSGKYYAYLDTFTTPPILVNDLNTNNFDTITTFDFTVDIAATITLTNFARMAALYAVVAIRRKDGTMVWLDTYEYLNSTDPGDFWAHLSVNPVTYTNTFTGVELKDGDYLYVTFSGVLNYYNLDAAAGDDAFTIVCTGGSFVATANSKKDPTPAKCFMINETISRAVEIITDNQIQGYSDYFGRTDSQPYAVDADGCGSLEVLTNGLLLRQKDSQMNISLKEIFEGIEPIHHCGFGLELNASGQYLLRVEKFDYFYNDTTLLVCDSVDKIKRSVIESEHYSTFRTGYQQWEAQEYNGIDEFLAKTGFRTTLTEVQNELAKYSSLVAGGYTIEITRRHSDDTTDWRYDNSNFIICVTRVDSTIVVEQGNISGAVNLIDPATILNFRISPARNAMRWAEKVFASYKIYSNDNKLIFIDGEGNYIAGGLMTGDFCRIESGVIQENDTITKESFNDVADSQPLLAPERIEFNYPVSMADFAAMLANPYGKIEYEPGKSGWIDTVTFTPREGKATFKLKPKYEIL